MEINLKDDGTIKDAVTAAILRSLDSGKREQLIKEAIAWLMVPEREGIHSISRLQQAFNAALDSLVRKMALDILERDRTVNDHIAGLILEAVSRLATQDREKTVERIANSIAQGLRGY